MSYIQVLVTVIVRISKYDYDYDYDINGWSVSANPNKAEVLNYLSHTFDYTFCCFH